MLFPLLPMKDSRTYVSLYNKDSTIYDFHCYRKSVSLTFYLLKFYHSLFQNDNTATKVELVEIFYTSIITYNFALPNKVTFFYSIYLLNI